MRNERFPLFRWCKKGPNGEATEVIVGPCVAWVIAVVVAALVHPGAILWILSKVPIP
ncbi:MAG TPA: hypothetical protein VGW33_01180 [Terriglobia bacterium]|nr:hypothetical protein [Terriglobia bacterium]